MATDPFAGPTAATLARAWRAYRGLNDSPMQRKLRGAHPCLVGAVYWNPQEESRAGLLRELKRIRATGFTFVRFHAIEPRELAPGRYDFGYPDLRMDLAAQAGLKVYPHFHLRRADEKALAAAGLTREQADRLGPTDPRVYAALRLRAQAIVGRYRRHPALAAWPLAGEPPPTPIPLADHADKQRFVAWLKRRHRTPAAVHRAWAIYPHKRPPFVATWDDALNHALRIKAGEGLRLATTGLKHEVYGVMRDLVRFRADQMLDDLRAEVALIREFDREHPIALGNHQLFINNAQLGWDIHASGRLADIHFSSIHLSWHFEQAVGEVDRPVYMQSRMTSDALKGGATSAYETTGGPVQFSGGYGNHMDAGLMRRLMFSYLAAGNEIIAFWDWRWRPGGIESGEYGLLTLSGAVSPWAREAGRVARAMEEYSAELWSAYEKPELALLRSWDTEMVLTVEPRRFAEDEGLSEFSRGNVQQHMRALMGAGRAAINQQVAFEYVTDEEILSGIAGVYPAIYLPGVRSCSDRLLEALLAYVRAGGRLIADVQLGFQDPWGKVRRRGRGTLLERLFGAWIDSIHDARTRPQCVDGLAAEGFYGDIARTGARVVRRFADGRAAVSEATIGRGQAVLIAFDPARMCWRPGRADVEAFLADIYRGPRPRRWWSDAPLVFRRSGAKADHWFFLNDGPARSAVLRVYDRAYRFGRDAVSSKPIDVSGTISVELPERSGVWLRLI